MLVCCLKIGWRLPSDQVNASAACFTHVASKHFLSPPLFLSLGLRLRLPHKRSEDKTYPDIQDRALREFEPVDRMMGTWMGRKRSCSSVGSWGSFHRAIVRDFCSVRQISDTCI